MTTTVSPLVPMLSDKLDNVIHQHHHQLRHQQATAPPARLDLSHRQVIPSSSSSSATAAAATEVAATAATTSETLQQQARHPGQRTGSASSSSASTSSSTANLSASSTSVDYLQQQQQQSHHQHQHQQHLDHHPASTTSALNGFYQAIQQRHNSSSSSLGDLTGKDQVESSNNPTAISLFSPWSNFTGAGISANNYPFPSPSLGFTLGDTFVPWTDAMVPSGLTPTLNGTMMDQQHGMQSHHQHAGGGAGFRDDNHHSQFFKQEYMGNAGMTFGLPMDDHDHSRRQGSLGGGDLRKESNASSLAAAGNNNNNNHGPGSVSRVDSSSSGASMASAQMDGNVRTPTPLFKGNNTNDSVAGGSGGGGGAGAGGSSFGEPSSGSYFTYPRPGGGAGDSNLLLSSAFQSGSAGVGEGSSRAPMQPQQLFHLNQPFQPAFTMQHNNNNHHHQQQQYMSVPPTLTQHPSHQHQQQQQLHHHLSSHGNGFLQTDRQNSRASTSSEFSSISPAMLNSRAPRASSPVSMFSDDALHPISAQTSPHSQPQNLPIHPGMQHVGLKRGSASSMMTDADDLDGDDLDGDEADGVEKNGMMWGMPTAAYRSLSARERKRVRNRISARTFRARRKEHLSVLEQDLSDRNALLKASQDEIKQLRNENAELRRRLMLCENEHH